MVSPGSGEGFLWQVLGLLRNGPGDLRIPSQSLQAFVRSTDTGRPIKAALLWGVRENL